MQGKLIKLRPSQVEATAKTQARVSIRPKVVSAYAEDIRKGDGPAFPAPVVFAEKGSERYILADGFHTRLAFIEAQGDEPITFELREGTMWDAKIYAAGANADHGERRRDKDIRNAIHMLLLDPNSEGWADTMIADTAKCHRTTVASVREKMIIDGELDPEKSSKRKHKRGDKEVTASVPPKKDKDKGKAKDKAKPKDKPKAKTQDEYDAEEYINAIQVLGQGHVCTAEEALTRYGLDKHIPMAEDASIWLIELLEASDRQKEAGKKKPKAKMSEADRAFLSA